MKKTGILIILTLFFSHIFAQQPTSQTRKYQDPESTVILKALQKKMTSYSDISIDFTFRSEKNEKFIDEITGFTYIKGNKYTLKTEQQHIFCDGTNIWNYLPEQKEVTLSLYEEEDDDQMMNPLKIIQNYEKYYKSDFIREVMERGTLIQVIDLTPLIPSSYYKVRLILDKNKKQLMRFTVYEKDGMQYTYAVNKFEVNQNLSDSQFSFDTAKYPGVEVIDIR
ncbi:MAG: outer membrane lipoprotein carrier protein LolA [Bacteroidales bacterium]|jgi:outer membrane lipoprotein-sorting protein|nr:outer membrane lipoprotein carrier protein LolA [Bacteroidales bacterium]